MQMYKLPVVKEFHVTDILLKDVMPEIYTANVCH